MTDIEETAKPVDGRVARRQRNVDAVLDVVLELFAEDAMFPTIEQVANRSGLSLRSLYRYFADPGELLEAAIDRANQRGREMSRLPSIGEGPLEARIDDFVAMRLNLHDEVGSVFRATLANAARHTRIQDQLAVDRNAMQAQFERQFAPELSALRGSARKAVLTSGDLVTQLDSIEFLRRHRRLSPGETRSALTTALQRLLG